MTTGTNPTIDPKALKDFIDGYVQPLGSIFLYLIFMIVIPLLLSALILGVAEIGQAKRFGKVGLKSLAMTILLSGIAVVIGLAAVNIVKPGHQISAEKRPELIARYRKQDKEELKDEMETLKKKVEESENERRRLLEETEQLKKAQDELKKAQDETNAFFRRMFSKE